LTFDRERGGLIEEIHERLLFVEEILNRPLSEVQLKQFNLYCNLLLEYNKRINLTAVTDPNAIIVRHFEDSLTCLKVTGDLNGVRIIDIGSGAGFPGVPLRIACPELDLTLVDSVTKKIEFLTSLARSLELTNVDIINRRAEQLGHDPDHRSQYDWAAARGVSSLPIVAEYLLPLVKNKGKMLAMKGKGVEREYADSLKAIRILGGGEADIKEVQLIMNTAVDNSVGSHVLTHYLVMIEKVKDTPDKYPRRVGVPSKRPLV
jgi:16S rRNA (guanine527-N7)-methyltransferase